MIAHRTQRGGIDPQEAERADDRQMASSMFHNTTSIIPGSYGFNPNSLWS